MIRSQPPVLPLALHFGAMNGLSIFAFFLILHYSGLNGLGPASWLGAWIPIVFMTLAVRKLRRDYQNDSLSFGQGFRISFLTAAFGALLFSLLLYLFGRLMEPDLLDRYIADSLQYLEESAEITGSILGEDLLDESMKQISEMTLTQLSTNEFMNKTLGGLLVSLVLALIFRKKPVQS